VPEGPSLVILREETRHFVGKTIVLAEGNTRTVDLGNLAGKRITSLRSWGKHFMIEMKGANLRIHFMLFGSYRIDERKDNVKPRMSLQFADGSELNFYACSIQPIDDDVDAQCDWDADVMSPTWDSAKARKKLRARPDLLVCDALLDQTIFAGVGNIIKNEVLFRVRLHPLSTIGALSAPKLRQLVEQARQYCFEFLEWKKAYVLRQHWLAHKKRPFARAATSYFPRATSASPAAIPFSASAARSGTPEQESK